MEKNSAITLRKHKAGQAPEGNDAIARLALIMSNDFKFNYFLSSLC